MAWDFTCPDTFAPSHLSRTMFQAGAAASVAENHKMLRYSSLQNTHVFIPFAVETMGAWGTGASDLLWSVGRRLNEVTEDPRSAFFLRQRVDVAIQRGNALSIQGTFPTETSAPLLVPLD